MRPLRNVAIAVLIAGGIAIALFTSPQAQAYSWFGYVVGGGDVVTQQRTVDAFHRVEVKGSTDVHVVVGGDRSVAVEAQPNIAPLIETTVSDGTLFITSHKSYSTRAKVLVHVAAPQIDGVASRGSADITLDGARGPSLLLSTFGSGDVTASGDIARLHYECFGSSTAKLVRLSARDAVVRIRGSGDAHLHVTQTLDVEIFGSGDVTYIGSPRISNQVVHGSGSVSAAGGE